ncbi:MAG: hypothetical protein IJW22_04635, partial [Clostridia bacterium]|nr:hypothetical protein [Clostridia bacterium]
MKKTKFQRLMAFGLALCFLIGGIFTVTAGAETGSTTDTTLSDIKEQLNAVSYEEYSSKILAAYERATASILINAADYLVGDKTTAEVNVLTDENGAPYALYTPTSGQVTWKVDIPANAKYSIVIEYLPDEAKSASIERILRINDAIPFAEARYLTLPKIWKNEYAVAKVTHESQSLAEIRAAAIAAGFAEADVSENATDNCVEVKIPAVWTEAKSKFVNEYSARFFITDIDDNELRPTTVQAPEWRTYELRDVDGFYAETFEFALNAGEQFITLQGVNEPMTIKSIALIPHEDFLTYDEYASKYAGEAAGKDSFVIQAEYTAATSTQTVYPVEDRTDAATQPADTNRTMLNTVGGEKWQTAGQWVRYSFTVATSGMYNIATRYRQNVLDGMYVNRALYISSKGLEKGAKGYYDGIPFFEASQLRFNYGTKWQTNLL